MIKKVVYSFYDKGNPYNHWVNKEYFLCALTHSVFQSLKYFEKVEMVTDSVSKKMFEDLDIPFTKISTELDELKNYPKELWALGKIKAYSIQNEPFIHLDNDLILNDNTNLDLLNEYDIAVSHKEENTSPYNIFYPKLLNALDLQVDTKIWNRYDYAFNMSIYACNNLKFNKFYTEKAFELVENNIEKFVNYEKQNTGFTSNTIYEQYLIAQLSQYKKLEVLVCKDALNYEHIERLKKDKFRYEHYLQLAEENYKTQYNEIIKE